jgi:uncharacterized repeat protein (TIGR03803 family)
LKTKLTSTKTWLTTLDNGSRTCEKTELLPGRKPALALLMRLLWAAALVLPAFGASASVVFTSLHSFQASTNGANPQAGLVQGSEGYFYGTTAYGGAPDLGTVFKISTNRAFTSLYSFTGGTDGANPQSGLVQGSEGYFYGTTPNGGQGGVGTVFRLTILPPQLTIIPSGAKVILTWPTDATGFTLQSTTNLASPAWITVTGQFAVTNPISGTQMFFRLKQ